MYSTYCENLLKSSLCHSVGVKTTNIEREPGDMLWRLLLRCWRNFCTACSWALVREALLFTPSWFSCSAISLYVFFSSVLKACHLPHLLLHLRRHGVRETLVVQRCQTPLPQGVSSNVRNMMAMCPDKLARYNSLAGYLPNTILWLTLCSPKEFAKGAYKVVTAWRHSIRPSYSIRKVHSCWN